MSGLLTKRNIPKQFRRTMFADYDLSRKEADAEAVRQIMAWEPTDERTSLVIIGDPGIGKTMLACAVLNERHGKIMPTDKNGDLTDRKATLALRQMECSVYFVQMAELIDLYFRLFRLGEMVKTAGISPAEWIEIDQLLQDFKYKVQYLVIDDVGKEHSTQSGFAEDTFDLLVRTRHNTGLSTIYTTNDSLRAWSNQYSKSMQNFITRTSLVVEFS